jgi:hypothetical protein
MLEVAAGHRGASLSDRPWWITIVQWTLWGVAVAALYGWIGRARDKPRGDARAGILDVPAPLLVIMWVTAGVFGAIAVLAAVFLGQEAPIAVTVGLTVFFAIPALLAAAFAHFYRHEIHRLVPGGVNIFKWTYRVESIRWSDVVELQYKPKLRWFYFRTGEGRIGRLGAHLRGLSEFALQALAAVPASAMDDDTRTILTETANGNPPDLFV